MPRMGLWMEIQNRVISGNDAVRPPAPSRRLMVILVCQCRLRRYRSAVSRHPQLLRSCRPARASGDHAVRRDRAYPDQKLRFYFSHFLQRATKVVSNHRLILDSLRDPDSVVILTRCCLSGARHAKHSPNQSFHLTGSRSFTVPL